MQVKLSLIPPSPVTNQITETVLCGLNNDSDRPAVCMVRLTAEAGNEQTLLGEKAVAMPPRCAQRVRFDFRTARLVGDQQIVVSVVCDEQSVSASEPLTVLESDVRATGQVGGAWAGIVHWSEREGARWNKDIRTMTDDDWRSLVVAMHDLSMDMIVIQEVFRNEQYVDRHNIETDGYHGKAFYPSKLFPGRMEMTASDPLGAILSQADELGMKVLIGVGMYAWFDFSKGSLEWHKKVASELFELYGHHKSFYSWYVSAEAYGNLGDTETQRQDTVAFFEAFQKHVQAIAPEKPVMLAPNCHKVRDSHGHYPALLANVDILCPFAFHRMPEDDWSGEEAAAWLQDQCDAAGAHLWMDMEAFLFGPDMELCPRPLDGLLSDMNRFPNFEKTLIYQFPGLLTSPNMRVRLGGDDAVKAHQDYFAWLKGTTAPALR